MEGSERIGYRGIIATASALLGVPGYEREVGDFVAREFAAYADEVTRDALENVVARIGRSGPRVMVCAHHDEIGLIVKGEQQPFQPHQVAQGAATEGGQEAREIAALVWLSGGLGCGQAKQRS